MIVLTLPASPCVPSLNRINDRGYPIVWHDGKPRRENRLAFVQATGCTFAAIEGLEVRHRCDNRACVNPDHLELGSHADNMRDMAERGRANPRRGSAHPVSKLTESEIPVIRQLLAAGSTQRAVAHRFGVDQALIGRIARRISWSHVA